MLKNAESDRIDFYISLTIIVSVLVSILSLLTLISQYDFITGFIKNNNQVSASALNQFSEFAKISILSFSTLIFSMFMILIIGSFLSQRNSQRQLEIARLKTDFVSTVSHELKTPVASIGLLSERLINLSDSELDSLKRIEYQKLIFKQSCRLTALIANLLALNKIESTNRENLNFEKVSLKSLAEKVLTDHFLSTIRPDCRIEPVFQENFPETLLDKNAMTRVLINLLDNALRFSPKKGIVSVRLTYNKDNIFLVISDDGPGIAEEETKQVFKKFYSKAQGTGLGLSIVKSIVEAHQGGGLK